MIRRAGQQLRELVKQAWKWANENPLAFFLALLVLIVVALILVQTIRQDNLGFADKSLWDWLDLFIVSAVVALGLFWLRQREDRRDKAREEQESKLAKADREQTALQAYYDKMADLILEGQLKKEQGRSIARARTLATLRALGSERKGSLLKFLYESELIGYLEVVAEERKQYAPIVSLLGADFAGANLRAAMLNGADFAGANLRRAKLRYASLQRVDLRVADLSEASLVWANLEGADLRGAILRGADLRQAILRGTDLRWAILIRADLSDASYDSFTKWPLGFESSSARARLFGSEEEE